MKMQKYIETRIEQLKEDMSRARDDYDKMWYNRCIQELEWALQMKNKPDHNCYMEESDGTGYNMSRF